MSSKRSKRTPEPKGKQTLVKRNRNKSSARAEESSSSSSFDNLAFYAFLNVGPMASTEEIKKSYYQLAKRLHPDKNPGDEAAAEKFKELSRIYTTLSDPKKRAEYDRFGDIEREGEPEDEEYDARMIYEAVMEYIRSIKRVRKEDIEDFFAKMERLRQEGAVDRDEDRMLREYYQQFDGDQKKILRHCNDYAAGYEPALDRKRFTKHIQKIKQEISSPN